MATKEELELEPLLENSKNGEGEDLVLIKPLQILVLGKTGSGKSSLINSVFGGDKVAKDKLGVEAQEHDPIEIHNRIIGGEKVTLYDTRGFCDPQNSDKKLKKEFIEKVKNIEFDLVWICIRMTERIDYETLNNFRRFSELCPRTFWKRSIFLLTFTNDFEQILKENDEEIDDKTLKERVIQELKTASRIVQKTLKLEDGIPFYPVGRIRKGKEEQDKKLSTSNNWLHDVMVLCVRQCPDDKKLQMKNVARKILIMKLGTAAGCAALCGCVGAVAGGVVGSVIFVGAGTAVGVAVGATVGTAVGATIGPTALTVGTKIRKHK